LRMFGRKSKVIEDVREEKQQYRRCSRGKAKLQRTSERKRKVTRMIDTKNNVTEDVREENQSDSACQRAKAKLPRMLWRKRNITVYV